jgi:hypothetical protein
MNVGIKNSVKSLQNRWFFLLRRFVLDWCLWTHAAVTFAGILGLGLSKARAVDRGLASPFARGLTWRLLTGGRAKRHYKTEEQATGHYLVRFKKIVLFSIYDR